MTMKIITLLQGSAEWHAHRAIHDNASDAPAMLGYSPHESRADLIRRLATGIAREVDAAQQQRFNDGHRTEALARPLAEEILGEEVYPVTGVLEGTRRSASFDGLTMNQRTAFEHKRINDRLREAMAEGSTGADLPLDYQVQMEQQCEVSGCERILFLATKWRRISYELPEEDPRAWELVEERHVWYTPNLDLRARIVAGWDQLREDVAAYVQPAAAELAPVMEKVAVLPSLNAEVSGGLVVTTNFIEAHAKVRAFIAALPQSPSTSLEFGQCKAAVKSFEEGEDLCKQQKAALLGKVSSIDEAVKTLDSMHDLMRTARLAVDKLVKRREQELKEEIVAVGRDGLNAHVRAVHDDVIGAPLLPPSACTADFLGAIKGKRSPESMREAVAELLASKKVDINVLANRIRANLDILKAQDAKHEHLFVRDHAELIVKVPEDLRAVVALRVDEFDKAEAVRVAEEAERIRKAAEEAVEQQRCAAIEPEPAPAATFTAAPAPASPVVMTSQTAIQPAANDPPTTPTLRIGDIANRLGWTMTAEQLRGLGIEPAAKERGATLYHEHQFPQICAAIVRRANEAAAAHAQRLAA